jgi:outer membrane protein assembly factor BamE (lipoprotein component of BamABCDE complex)
MKFFFTLLFVAVFNTACIDKVIHQGNVLNPDSIWIIQEGDTRFSVEVEMGPPAIKDADHPERMLYIEDVYDEETDEKYTRGVEVTYDEAWRVKSIRRFGFE